MGNKIFRIVLCAMSLAVSSCAHAQQPAKIPRIGWLSGAPLSTITTRMDAFRRGLRELGYVEGKNIIVEWRAADGKVERLATIAAELVRLKVDALVTGGPIVTRAAREATKTIPIVMTNEFDTVGTGYVASLARPGGNITGLSSLAPELSGNRLELLKEILPKLSRVAVFSTSTVPGNAETRKELELVAAAFKVEPQFPDILSI